MRCCHCCLPTASNHREPIRQTAAAAATLQCYYSNNKNSHHRDGKLVNLDDQRRPRMVTRLRQASKSTFVLVWHWAWAPNFWTCPRTTRANWHQNHFIRFQNIMQGDHSPNNVKFTDISLMVRGTRHVKCYSYHARTSTKYLYGHKYAAYNKQF